MKRQVLVTSLIIAVSTTWVNQPVKATSTGGMKIVAVAEGDCAVDSQTIVITDATTSCSISVAVTPAKKYIHAELIAPIDKRSTKNGWSTVGFMFGGSALAPMIVSRRMAHEKTEGTSASKHLWLCCAACQQRFCRVTNTD